MSEKLYPAASPLGAALRRIAAKKRMSSLDVPVLEDAAQALDESNEWWVYSTAFLTLIESVVWDLSPDLASLVDKDIQHLKTLRNKLKGS